MVYPVVETDVCECVLVRECVATNVASVRVTHTNVHISDGTVVHV